MMARAGLCSRRDAERWIEEGRVLLNGVRLTTPAQTITEKDDLRVDGQRVAAAPPARLWRYHKPAGRLTTHRDPEGRPTVFEALPDDMPRIVSVGRLDFTTEGLLLLTTRGDLARHLELPATGWRRRYRVRLYGHPSDDDFARLADGMTVDGIHYGPIDAALERRQGANSWIAMTLREGKNREIRRVLGALGYDVSRLIRISYGPFQLGDLASGKVEEIKPRVLAEQLGRETAQTFGVEASASRRGNTEQRAGVQEPTRPARGKPRLPQPAKTNTGDAAKPRKKPSRKPTRGRTHARPERSETVEAPDAPKQPRRGGKPQKTASDAKPNRPAKPRKTGQPKGSARPGTAPPATQKAATRRPRRKK
ncbi:MAG: pseudouridine synthase [Pseudomonadota bacterium]